MNCGFGHPPERCWNLSLKSRIKTWFKNNSIYIRIWLNIMSQMEMWRAREKGKFYCLVCCVLNFRCLKKTRNPETALVSFLLQHRIGVHFFLPCALGPSRASLIHFLVSKTHYHTITRYQDTTARINHHLSISLPANWWGHSPPQVVVSWNEYIKHRAQDWYTMASH